jgi:hypothetical protein
MSDETDIMNGYEPPSRKSHNFAESAERSRQLSYAPWWLDVYRRAFGSSLASVVYVNNDGWAQRAGIDRVLTFNTGRIAYVDEKVREEVWSDIALEQWSDLERQSPGWIQKPLACDYIAYAFVPSATCYLLPTLTLQRAWRLHGRDWVGQYQKIKAHNKYGGRSWTTLSIAVPIPVLMAALNDAMKVVWSEGEEEQDS